MYSGFGGQVDFIRGAAESVDGRGKPIIALVSTTKRNETKIVPTLKVGQYLINTSLYRLSTGLLYLGMTLIYSSTTKLYRGMVF